MADDTTDCRIGAAREPFSDGSGAALMIPPSIAVVEIRRELAVVRDPARQVTLQLSRPVYELFRRFARPRWVEDVLPAESPRRERALECVRQLQRNGFLVAPATVIPAL